MSFSVKATTLATAAVKGSVAAKGAGVVGALGAICSPLLAIFGNYTSYRMSLDEARTEEERYHIKKLFRSALLITLTFTAAIAFPLYHSFRSQTTLLIFCAELFSQSIVIYFLTLATFFISTLRQRQRYLKTVLTEQYAGQMPKAAFEYRSAWSLFGLPLIHVRIGDRFDVMRGPVKAWIAIGSSHAVGVLFASGGLAVAPFSFGGIAIGLFSFGGISLGIIALGAIAFGSWAYGAFCIGWQIYCGSGFAWHTAAGGLVMARDYAIGGVAHAAQANTQIANEVVQQTRFFRISSVLNNHGFLMMLAWTIPMIVQARIILRARRREQTNS